MNVTFKAAVAALILTVAFARSVAAGPLEDALEATERVTTRPRSDFRLFCTSVTEGKPVVSRAAKPGRVKPTVSMSTSGMSELGLTSAFMILGWNSSSRSRYTSLLRVLM